MSNQARNICQLFFSGYRSLLFPFALAALVLTRYATQPGVTTDGVVYLQMARNILLTKSLGWQAGMFLPLHSILIATVSYLFHIKDLVVAAGIVSHAMFILLVTAVYALTYEIFDRRTAILASLITAFFPHLITIANSSEPEITYTFFLILSLLLFYLAIKKQSWIIAVLTGVAFAMAYMTRSEAFIIMGAIFISTTAMQGQRFYRTTIFRSSVLATLAFFVVTMPYLLKLKNDYGQFVLHPKATNVMLIVKWHVPYDNQTEVSYSDLWKLQKDGRFLWQEPKGGRDLLKLFFQYPRESLSYYLKSFAKQIPGRIPNNSGMEKYPQVFPIYLAIAALFAFCWGPWGEFAREKKCLLLAPFLILFTLPLLGGWWKYMVPYLPVLIILASRGLVNTATVLSAKLSIHEKINTGQVVVFTAMLLLIVRFVVAMQPDIDSKPTSIASYRATYNEEVKKVGVWASQRFEPGKNYMIQWSRLIYYLNGLWTPDPVADIPDIIAFARKSGVDYFVKEIRDDNLTLEQLKNTPVGIEFVDMYVSNESNYRVAFFKLLK